MCAAKEFSSAFPIRSNRYNCKPNKERQLSSRRRLSLPAWIFDIGVSPVAAINNFGFTSSELRQLRALKTPAGIQKFLDDLPYNLSFTARSPRKVLHDRTASC